MSFCNVEYLQERLSAVCKERDELRWELAKVKAELHEAKNYTTEMDKNGRRIYRGDICKLGDKLYKVEWQHARWLFRRIDGSNLPGPWFASTAAYCEVVTVDELA